MLRTASQTVKLADSDVVGVCVLCLEFGWACGQGLGKCCECWRGAVVLMGIRRSAKMERKLHWAASDLLRFWRAAAKST